MNANKNNNFTIKPFYFMPTILKIRLPVYVNVLALMATKEYVYLMKNGIRGTTIWGVYLTMNAHKNGYGLVSIGKPMTYNNIARHFKMPVSAIHWTVKRCLELKWLTVESDSE